MHVIFVPAAVHPAQPVGHYTKVTVLFKVYLTYEALGIVHLSAVAPLHTSHPGAQAVTEDVSKKNLGATYKHSLIVEPKHKIQFAMQGLIAEMAELLVVKEFPTKYLPQPAIGVQSISVLYVMQVHLSVL